MTLDDMLKKFGEDSDVTKAVRDWLATQPLPIRDLANRFPPLTKILSNGRVCFIIGYTETVLPDHPHLLCSWIHPVRDEQQWEEQKETFTVCPNEIDKEPLIS
jgi:hypothetical protein